MGLQLYRVSSLAATPVPHVTPLGEHWHESASFAGKGWIPRVAYLHSAISNVLLVNGTAVLVRLVLGKLASLHHGAVAGE